MRMQKFNRQTVQRRRKEYQGMLFILSMINALGLSPVGYLANAIGTTEPALKLLISVIASYPQAIIYKKYIKDEGVAVRNSFFIITGTDMAFYNFGASMYHNVIAAVVFMVSIKLLGPGQRHAIWTFAFNMLYLVVGYIATESDDYDITWTMPQCVLTLKLIALSFDLWDGQKKPEELSQNNKETALTVRPSFFELIGFVFFPPCFLVGPMFSFKRYHTFISGGYPLDQETESYENYALKRLLQGFAYLMAFQVGVSVFSMKYMLSEEFLENSIFYRHFYCGLWAHFALYKYIACWLLTEAACIRYGFSYNGRDEKGEAKWNGCTNILLMRFESATRFQHYIDSFNCNTNYFAAEYVYKRLKFLGNRNLSQLLTLFFLAVWHGTQSGYYATFFNEFIIMIMEKDLEPLLVRTKLYHQVWAHPVGKTLLYIILKTYTIVFMGWSLVPISVKTFPRWWQVYQSLWFSGFLLFVPWSFVYKPLVVQIVKRLEPVAVSEKNK